jgi:hypothetical protein
MPWDLTSWEVFDPAAVPLITLATKGVGAAGSSLSK